MPASAPADVALGRQRRGSRQWYQHHNYSNRSYDSYHPGSSFVARHPLGARNGANGLLVDGHSVLAITTAMLQLRTDPALRDRLRAGGFTAAAAADWRVKAQAFVAMLTASRPGKT